MSVGLFALLDDVAALAKVAAASLDDVVAQSLKAGTKAAGVVIDDAAVTPRYATGFAAERELPIVWKIARGSLRNKILFLLPGALLFGLFAPGLITPLLMIGGIYLCYEGVEKLYELVAPHAAHHHEDAVETVALDAQTLEDQKVAGAIKTDFILSAEIMAIALSTVAHLSTVMQAIVLAVVALGITVAVYGAVAIIVKADDVGVALARNGSGRPFGPALRGLGRLLVVGMPGFLALLGMVGIAAMIWVGGGILVHGLEKFGLGGIAHFLHDLAKVAAAAVPAIGGLASWLVEAVGAGFVGLLVGGLTIPLMSHVISPLWRSAKRLRVARAGGAA